MSVGTHASSCRPSASTAPVTMSSQRAAAVTHGILPVIVSPEDLEKLMDDARRGANATLTVDLESQTIKGPDGGTVTFDIDSARKHRLLNGIDDIGDTMQNAPAIETFEGRMAQERPWV